MSLFDDIDDINDPLGVSSTSGLFDETSNFKGNSLPDPPTTIPTTSDALTTKDVNEKASSSSADRGLGLDSFAGLLITDENESDDDGLFGSKSIPNSTSKGGIFGSDEEGESEAASRKKILSSLASSPKLKSKQDYNGIQSSYRPTRDSKFTDSEEMHLSDKATLSDPTLKETSLLLAGKIKRDSLGNKDNDNAINELFRKDTRSRMYDKGMSEKDSYNLFKHDDNRLSELGNFLTSPQEEKSKKGAKNKEGEIDLFKTESGDLISTSNHQDANIFGDNGNGEESTDDLFGTEEKVASFVSSKAGTEADLFRMLGNKDNDPAGEVDTKFDFNSYVADNDGGSGGGLFD